ncbi:hypothetical protein R6Q57_006841 [Mikania cordata]
MQFLQKRSIENFRVSFFSLCLDIRNGDLVVGMLALTQSQFRHKRDRQIPNMLMPKNVYKDPDDGRQRFLLELEFVQCLANPTYIHYLAQNRYFEDEAFIGYLKYLQYWQQPEYIKYIMYPHCLYFLELIQNASFRNAMAHPANKELTHRQQFYFWKNYRNNRLKHILPRPLPEPTAAPPSNALPPPMATTMAASSVPVSAPPVPSPMQYGVPSGQPLAKNDPRNAIDRRKRKFSFVLLVLLRIKLNPEGDKYETTSNTYEVKTVVNG